MSPKVASNLTASCPCFEGWEYRLGLQTWATVPSELGLFYIPFLSFWLRMAETGKSPQRWTAENSKHYSCQVKSQQGRTEPQRVGEAGRKHWATWVKNALCPSGAP